MISYREALQLVVEGFAPAARFRRQQDASGKFGDECLQCAGGRLKARADFQIAERARGVSDATLRRIGRTGSDHPDQRVPVLEVLQFCAA